MSDALLNLLSELSDAFLILLFPPMYGLWNLLTIGVLSDALLRLKCHRALRMKRPRHHSTGIKESLENACQTLLCLRLPWCQGRGPGFIYYDCLSCWSLQSIFQKHRLCFRPQSVAVDRGHWPRYIFIPWPGTPLDIHSSSQGIYTWQKAFFKKIPLRDRRPGLDKSEWSLRDVFNDV